MGKEKNKLVKGVVFVGLIAGLITLQSCSDAVDTLRTKARQAYVVALVIWCLRKLIVISHRLDYLQLNLKLEKIMKIRYTLIKS